MKRNDFVDEMNEIEKEVILLKKRDHTQPFIWIHYQRLILMILNVFKKISKDIKFDDD